MPRVLAASAKVGRWWMGYDSILALGLEDGAGGSGMGRFRQRC